MDLEFRIVDDDMDVGRVCLTVICALHVAAAQVWNQGAGVRDIILGLVDQATGLVVNVAVGKGPGALFPPAEGEKTLHFAACGAHEGLEFPCIRGRHG